MLFGLSFDLVIVEQLGLGIEAIGDDIEHFAADIDRRPVGQVAAVRQAHPQNRVTGLEHRKIDPLVGLTARMGLDIGIVGAEQFLDAGDRQFLGNIDKFAAAVISLAWIALGHICW